MKRLRRHAVDLAWKLIESRLARRSDPDLGGTQPVFLLFTPRCGSKHFLSLLESIPGARFDFEILGSGFKRRLAQIVGLWSPMADLIPSRVKQCEVGPHIVRPSYGTAIFSDKSLCLSYVAHCLQALGSPVCAVKFQYEQLQLGGITPHDLHEAFPAAKFVVLYRRSMSRQLVSDVMRHLTGETSRRPGRPHREGQRTFKLAAPKVSAYYAALRAIYSEWLALPFLSRHGTVLCYEDLCDAPQATFDDFVFPMLGLKSTPVSNRRYVKQISREVSDIVENHAEIADLLQGPASVQDYSAWQRHEEVGPESVAGDSNAAS